MGPCRTRISEFRLRIEITGPIASGKSTLARVLASLPGWTLAREVPEAVPFWAETYNGERSYQLEKDMGFLLFHALHIREAQSRSGERLICDFSFLQDLAYAELGQDPGELIAYQMVHDHLSKIHGKPALIINLHCPTPVLLARIRQRGRQPEQGISADFLDSLRDRTDTHLARGAVPLVEIDSEAMDFRRPAKDVLRMVLPLLPLAV